MKKATIEILVNFSELKSENEELFTQGEKLIKSLVKEFKTFFSQDLNKSFKINITNIGKPLEEIDLSRFRGFILDPLTLSKLEKIRDSFLDVFLFDPLGLPYNESISTFIYGVFDINAKNNLKDKFFVIDNLIFYAVSLTKKYNIYLEDKFIFPINIQNFNPYVRSKEGILFLNEFKKIAQNIKDLSKSLKKIREEYKLFSYKLREKNVIKNKKKMQEEILSIILEYSNILMEKNYISNISLLFIYKDTIYRDVFRQWLFKEILSKNILDAPYCNFSVYSPSEGREIFGFIPNNLSEEEIIPGILFENQGNVIILEDLPDSYEFYEKLLFFLNFDRILPYGKKVEIYAPSVTMAFIDHKKFMKFKKYLPFPHIFNIPSPFPRENLLEFLSVIISSYGKTQNKKKDLFITYEAFSYFEKALFDHGIETIILTLRELITHLDSSNIIRKELFQEFLNRFL